MSQVAIDRRAYPAGLRLSRWRAPDGWDHRRFDWPAPDSFPPRGGMIFQTGRGDFFEKYIESLAEWNAAGWSIRGFDWRGQSGSGRFLNNPSVGHVESFDIWREDLDRFVAEWIDETPTPHVIVSHSMGGNLVMRLLIDRRRPIDAVVFSAPMLEMVSRPFGTRLGRLITRAFVGAGFAEQHAWQENERPSLPGSSRQRLLTTDLARYEDESAWVERSPQLRMGPPSWRWLLAAYASSKAIFAPGALEAVTTPVLLLGAARDKLVSPAAIRLAAARLPDARLVMDSEAAHEVLRERDAIRAPLMRAIRDFLDEKAPAPG